MSVEPFLSICVPSRNRQIYFQETIRALRASLRTDIQLVLADNSDDPSIMNDFMEDVVKDPRVVYLPSTGQALSMVDNWERTAEAATGQYMVFIGDDDYVDPEVAAFLQRVLEHNPDVDAFSWRLIGYTWPYEGRGKIAALVPFDDSVVKVPQSDLYKRMFGWYDCRHVPTSGFSIYHSAVSRRLMQRIKLLYGGRFFEHPVVDYDNAFKVIMLGTHFVATARPFGVMGSCPASNSFAVGKLEDFRKKMIQFTEEVGRDFDADTEFREFPFHSSLGTTATIGVAQQWFKQKYHLTYENWGEGFAKACTFDCHSYPDLASFEAARDAYHKAFSLWEGGKYLKFFNPTFDQNKLNAASTVASGCTDDGIYIDHDVPSAQTPADMFALVRAMVTAVDLMDIDPTGLKFPWEVESRTDRMRRA